MWRSLPIAAAVVLIGASGRAQQPCTADPMPVVTAIYQQLLERDPDPASRALMYDLASGRGTVRQNVAGVALSREHQERFLWPRVADAAFRATRNARPDDGELGNAIQALSSRRAAVRDVVAAFATDEAMSQAPPMRMLVLYQRILGREPDTMAPRAEQFGDRRTVNRVARGMVESEEYSARVGPHGIPRSHAVTTYADAVRVLYRHLLGREADEGGLRGAAEFAATRGLLQLIPYLLSSPEYMQRFGEHGVPGPGGPRVVYCGPKR